MRKFITCLMLFMIGFMITSFSVASAEVDKKDVKIEKVVKAEKAIDLFAFVESEKPVIFSILTFGEAATAKFITDYKLPSGRSSDLLCNSNRAAINKRHYKVKVKRHWHTAGKKHYKPDSKPKGSFPVGSVKI
jgi:hypothetical protein